MFSLRKRVYFLFYQCYVFDKHSKKMTVKIAPLVLLISLSVLAEAGIWDNPFKAKKDAFPKGTSASASI